MTPRIQAHNLVFVKPTLIGADQERRLSVGIIRPMMRVERVHRHSQGSIDAIRTRVRADGVSMSEMLRSMGDDDGATSRGSGCAPFERVWLDLALIGLVDKGWQGGVTSD